MIQLSLPSASQSPSPDLIGEKSQSLGLMNDESSNNFKRLLPSTSIAVTIPDGSQPLSAEPSALEADDTPPSPDDRQAARSLHQASSQIGILSSSSSVHMPGGYHSPVVRRAQRTIDVLADKSIVERARIEDEESGDQDDGGDAANGDHGNKSNNDDNYEDEIEDVLMHSRGSSENNGEALDSYQPKPEESRAASHEANPQDVPNLSDTPPVARQSASILESSLQLSDGHVASELEAPAKPFSSSSSSSSPTILSVRGPVGTLPVFSGSAAVQIPRPVPATPVAPGKTREAETLTMARKRGRLTSSLSPQNPPHSQLKPDPKRQKANENNVDSLALEPESSDSGGLCTTMGEPQRLEDFVECDPPHDSLSSRSYVGDVQPIPFARPRPRPPSPPRSTSDLLSSTFRTRIRPSHPSFVANLDGLTASMSQVLPTIPSEDLFPRSIDGVIRSPTPPPPPSSGDLQGSRLDLPSRPTHQFFDFVNPSRPAIPLRGKGKVKVEDSSTGMLRNAPAAQTQMPLPPPTVIGDAPEAVQAAAHHSLIGSLIADDPLPSPSSSIIFSNDGAKAAPILSTSTAVDLRAPPRDSLKTEAVLQRPRRSGATYGLRGSSTEPPSGIPKLLRVSSLPTAGALPEEPEAGKLLTSEEITGALESGAADGLGVAGTSTLGDPRDESSTGRDGDGGGDLRETDDESVGFVTGSSEPSVRAGHRARYGSRSVRGATGAHRPRRNTAQGRGRGIGPRARGRGGNARGGDGQPAWVP